MTHILTIFLKHERLVVFFGKEAGCPLPSKLNPGEMEGGRPVAPRPGLSWCFSMAPEVILPSLGQSHGNPV